jgi:ribosomal protein S27AE
MEETKRDEDKQRRWVGRPRPPTRKGNDGDNRPKRTPMRNYDDYNSRMERFAQNPFAQESQFDSTCVVKGGLFKDKSKAPARIEHGVVDLTLLDRAHKRKFCPNCGSTQHQICETPCHRCGSTEHKTHQCDGNLCAVCYSREHRTTDCRGKSVFDNVYETTEPSYDVELFEAYRPIPATPEALAVKPDTVIHVELVEALPKLQVVTTEIDIVTQSTRTIKNPTWWSVVKGLVYDLFVPTTSYIPCVTQMVTMDVYPCIPDLATEDVSDIISDDTSDDSDTEPPDTFESVSPYYEDVFGDEEIIREKAAVFTTVESLLGSVFSYSLALSFVCEIPYIIRNKPRQEIPYLLLKTSALTLMLGFYNQFDCTCARVWRRLTPLIDEKRHRRYDVEEEDPSKTFVYRSAEEYTVTFRRLPIMRFLTHPMWTGVHDRAIHHDALKLIMNPRVLNSNQEPSVVSRRITEVVNQTPDMHLNHTSIISHQLNQVGDTIQMAHDILGIPLKAGQGIGGTNMVFAPMRSLSPWLALQNLVLASCGLVIYCNLLREGPLCELILDLLFTELHYHIQTLLMVLLRLMGRFPGRPP